MKYKTSLCLLIVFYFILNFLPSFYRDLWEPDEPRFVLVAKEMVESGNYIMPHRNKKPYPDKPPFFFWTIVASSKITGGFNTPAGILPVATAGALSILLVFLIALKLGFDEKIALASSIIFASSPKVWWQSSHAQIDMVLAFLVYLSIYLALLYLQKNRELYLSLSFFVMGLATLAKGPVGFIIPLGSIIVYLLWTKKWKNTKIFTFKSLLSYLLPVGLWLALLIAQSLSSGNTAYLENILFKQTVVRFAKSWHHFHPVYYYLKVIVYDFFPWSIFLYYFLWFLWKNRKEYQLSDSEKFLLSWFLFTVIFFSLPSGKRGLYILPMYPAISIFTAVFIMKLKNEKFVKIAGISSAIILFALFLGLSFYEYKIKIPFTLSASLLFNATALLFIALFLILRREPLFNDYFKIIIVISFSFFLLASETAGRVFPYLNKRNSMRFFVKEYEKYLNPDSKVAICQYRSAHVFYGNRNLVEFPYKDEEDNIDKFVKFLRETPNSFGIVSKLWCKRLLNMGIPVKILAERKVGHKNLCFIKIEKEDNKDNRD